MITEEQRQQIIQAHRNQPKEPAEIIDIKNKIEEYHVANWQACHPAGLINDWVYKAVYEKIVQPLQEEIEQLKK